MNTLRQLQHTKTQQEKNLKQAKIELENITAKIDKISSDIKALEKQITKAKEITKLAISEHAKVRFFERILGFDMAQIEEQICPPHISELVSKTFKNTDGKYPVNKTHKIIVVNGVISTVVNN